VYFDLITDAFDHPWTTNLATPTCSGINGTPFELPADIVVPYGHNSFLDAYPTHTSVTQFVEADFLLAQGCPPPASGTPTLLSQWNQPVSGNSPPKKLKSTSINAVRVLTLPQCSTAVNVQDEVFSAVSGLVTGAIECTHVSSFAPVPVIPPLGIVGEIFPTLTELTASTYLSHQDASLTNYPNDLGAALASKPLAFQGVIGGVILKGSAHATMQVDYNTLGLDVDVPCDVSFIYDYRYGIDSSGTFNITPLRVQLDATEGSLCNGGFGGAVPGLKDKFQDLLENQIPTFASSFASSKQVVPPSTPTSPSPWQFRCDFLSGDDVLTKCSQARTTLQLGVDALAAPVLGLSTTSGLDAAINDAANWRCRKDTPAEITYDCAPPPDSNGNTVAPSYTSGRCEFVLPATDVIAEPDEIRIVWPPLNDFANMSPPAPEASPSTVAFVLSFASSKTAYQALCTPPTEVASAKPFYQRYFATLNVPAQQCHEPGPPGGPIVCGCSADINCVDRFGNGHRCVAGFCQ